MASPKFVALLLLVAACVDDVTLGRECIVLDLCRPPPSTPSDDVPVLDASVEPPLDATAPVVDAAREAAVLQPVIDARVPTVNTSVDNGSFELTTGTGGTLAYESFLYPLGTNFVAPWKACRYPLNAVLRADSVAGSGAGDVQPRAGDAFVEAEVNVGNNGGLQQQLSTPLEAGMRYAFRIDARTTAGAASTLELWGSNISCVPGSKLADFGALPESWASLCASFTAPERFTFLMVVAAPRGDVVGIPRVFYDDLRTDGSCF